MTSKPKNTSGEWLIRAGDKYQEAKVVKEAEIRATIADTRKAVDDIIKQTELVHAKLQSRQDLQKLDGFYDVRPSGLKTNTYHYHLGFRFMEEIKEFDPNTAPYWQRQQTPAQVNAYRTSYERQINNSINDWKKLIKRIDVFENRLNKKILKSGDWFPRITTGTPGNPAGTKMEHYGVPDLVQCKVCEHIIREMGLGAHQATARCKDIGRRNGLHKAGYVLIRGNVSLANLARSGDLPEAEMIPTAYDIYVPRWVEVAQQAYGKKGDSFAGLSLKEYITKMGPESFKTVPNGET